MLQLPALILSALLVSAYALLFYLWQGRGLRHLLVFWLASIVGFALGQTVGAELHLIPWTVGQVSLVEASAGAFLCILAANWLKPQAKRP
jgi:uncharacterized membrane-anchored protein